MQLQSIIYNSIRNASARAWLFYTKHRTILTLVFILVFCLLQSTAFLADTSLGDSVSNVSDNALAEVERVYCGSLFYLILAAGVIGFFVLKNDKVKAAFGVMALGSIIAYVVIKIAAQRSGGAIGKTLDEITEWAQ